MSIFPKKWSVPLKKNIYIAPLTIDQVLVGWSMAESIFSYSK